MKKGLIKTIVENVKNKYLKQEKKYRRKRRFDCSYCRK